MSTGTKRPSLAERLDLRDLEERDSVQGDKGKHDLRADGRLPTSSIRRSPQHDLVWCAERLRPRSAFREVWSAGRLAGVVLKEWKSDWPYQGANFLRLAPVPQ